MPALAYSRRSRAHRDAAARHRIRLLERRCRADHARLGSFELAAAEIEKLGFRIAIYPGLERYAAGFAIREALGALKRDGSTRAVQDRMLTMPQYNEVLELSDVEGWEKKYLR